MVAPKIDTTINLGNVLLLGGMIVGMIVAWNRVSDRTVLNTNEILQIAATQEAAKIRAREFEVRIVTLERDLDHATRLVVDIDANVKRLQATLDEFRAEVNRGQRQLPQ